MSRLWEEIWLSHGDASLAGVLTAPADDAEERDTIAIFLNAGLIHHAGPHRLYVQAARRLARAGFRVLRFDSSGIGDSPPRDDHLPYETSSVLECRQALDDLEAKYNTKRFFLCGICSGAMTALETAKVDDRVQAIALINTQSYRLNEQLDSYLVNKEKSHYFWRVSMANPKSWKAALTGKVAYRDIIGMLTRSISNRFRKSKDLVGADPELLRNIEASLTRGVATSLIYSPGDAAFEFYRLCIEKEKSRLHEMGQLEVKTVTGADHTFTPCWSQIELEEIIASWAIRQSKEIENVDDEPMTGLL